MKKLVFLFWIVILGACSPRVLVPLTFDLPTDDDTALISEYDSVSVVVKNLAVKGGYMVFDLEVNNRSDQAIEVIPEHICYYGSQEPFPSVGDAEDIHAVTMFYQNQFNYKELAMRPSDVEAYFLERLRVKQGVGMILFLAGAGLVIHDAVQDQEDFYQPLWTESDAKKAAARDIFTASSLVAIDIAGEGINAAAQKDRVELQYLPDELFSNNVIQPGQSIRGKVLFRKMESFKYCRMIVPIENTDFVFDFRKPTPEEKKQLNTR